MNKKPLIETRTVPEAPELSGLPRLLARIYSARGVRSADELNYRLNRMLSPTFKGMEAAVSLIAQAMSAGQRILVAGDFDTDGATSTALVIRCLSKMGAQYVNYVVPNRAEFGYGLSKELVDYSLQYEPDLIITVDNGISSIEGVAYAQSLGIRVVVTDHHLPPDVLPSADAIVNPNLIGDEFPSKCLAGVGVAFYVMVALRAHLRTIQWFEQKQIPEMDLRDVLDLVALGTVADVVPLDFNNRLLVTHGMQKIRSGQTYEGIKALFNVAKREIDNMHASDLGFAIAPRLNAAGRLEDMSVGVECLLTDDASRAHELATALDSINQDRRAIESQMKEDAFSALDILEKNVLKQEADMPAAICLYQADWHSGVVGILAARVKEKYHRPVVVFADESDGQLKGSARSVNGVHIKDVLEYIHSHHTGVMTKFGGHAMAAGLSLPKANLSQFETLFAARVESLMGHNIGQKVYQTDGELDTSEMTLSVADQLQNAGPWGQAFPEPVFFGVFEIVDKRLLKDAHLKMVVEKDGVQFDAIAFNEKGECLQNNTAVTLVYTLSVNLFRHRRSLQLMVQYLEPCNEIVIER